MTGLTLEQRTDLTLKRLRRMADGAQPTPSLQVVARDTADLIEELAASATPTPAPEDKVEEPKAEQPKRRGRKPKVEEEVAASV